MASDRISTYDVVHPTPIPGKGASSPAYRCSGSSARPGIVPNHLVSVTDGVPGRGAWSGDAACASSRCCRSSASCVATSPAPGWKDYRSTGRGLRNRASRRVCASPIGSPSRIFTPSTKADDRPRRGDRLRGRGWAGRRPRRWPSGCATSRSPIYQRAAEHARERGIILADTKFEFGLDAERRADAGRRGLHARLVALLARRRVRAGRGQPSFDKQFVRDWASSTGWDRTPPAPPIPDEVVIKTREKYVEAYERITGEPFDSWLGRTGAR